MDKEQRDGRPTTPLYVVELREAVGESDAEIAIVELFRNGDSGIVPTDIWTKRLASADAARTMFQTMLAHPELWSLWAKSTQILGADFAAGLIKAQADTDASVAAWRAEHARRKAARLVRRALRETRIVVRLVLKPGEGKLVATRGSREFMVLRLETAVEARRVWDWVRWQRAAFREWYALVELRGAAALESLILSSMLAEERRIRAAGLSAGGGRPLRFWRPEDRKGLNSD